MMIAGNLGRRLVGVLGVLWLWGGGARAEEAGEAPAPAPVLTLEECVQIALKQHPSLAVAEENASAARAGLREAQSAVQPQLTLNSQYNTFKSARSGYSIGSPGADELRETSVALSQLIWDSGLSQASVRQSQATLQASRWSQEETRQTVTFNVASRYYAVLRAQALVRLNEAVVARTQRDVDLAQTAFDAGTGARLDIDRAQVKVANAQVDLIAVRNQVRTALADLKNALGVPWTTEVQLAEGPPLADLTLSLEEAVPRALAQRPELKRLHATSSVRNQALRVAKIQRRPQLNLSGNYEKYLDSTRDVDFEWFAGATLSAPLFDGGQTKAAVDAARAQLDAAKAQEEQTRQAVAQEVEQSHVALNDARQRLEAARQSVTLATENLTASEESYREGAGSLLEVNDSQVELTRAETNLIQAQYDLSLALLTLRKALGEEIVVRQ